MTAVVNGDPDSDRLHPRPTNLCRVANNDDAKARDFVARLVGDGNDHLVRPRRKQKHDRRDTQSLTLADRRATRFTLREKRS
jgi:hypothetical protein